MTTQYTQEFFRQHATTMERVSWAEDGECAPLAYIQKARAEFAVARAAVLDFTSYETYIAWRKVWRETYATMTHEARALRFPEKRNQRQLRRMMMRIRMESKGRACQQRRARLEGRNVQYAIDGHTIGSAIDRTPDGKESFAVWLIDMPGCIAQGDSLEEANAHLAAMFTEYMASLERRTMQPS